jgi:hypothetical protein
MRAFKEIPKIIVCIYLLAMVASGCVASRMGRISEAIQTYQSVLHAELSTSVVSIAVGQTLPLEFRLSNVGRIAVDACIGEARRYSIASDSRAVGTGRPSAGETY